MDNAQCCISDVEEFACCYRKSFATYIIAWYEEQLRKQEPVYLFRRKGLDDFCVCDKRRYEELEKKRNLFEVKKLYAHPQPAPNMWQPIETAPKDGTRIELLGANGKLDVGEWCEWSEYFDKAANGIAEDVTGEFSTEYGEGPHTHWRELSYNAEVAGTNDPNLN